MSIIDRYRPYQLRLHAGVHESYKAGHRRIMAMLATGGGKTLTAAGMIERALQAKSARPGRPAIFIVPKITLAEQTGQVFHKLGFDVSIMQADHPAFRRSAPVQVCSAQTLERRPDEFDEAAIVIVDEAHIRRKFYAELAYQWPNIPFIGLSATPTSKGLAKVFTDLVVGTTTGDLVNDGWLVSSRVFEPSVYDVSGVASGNTESGFNERQLKAAIDGQKEIHGDVVKNWLEHADNRPTLCFPANCNHSREIVSRFIDADVSAMHIDAKTAMIDRSAAFQRVKDGTLKVISSVGCLTEGLDLTLASCLIFARPVKSLETHLQMWGRGLRPVTLEDADGQAFDLVKHDCRVFDHGGNTLRLMHAEDYAPTELHDGTPKESGAHLSQEAKEKGALNKCSQCDAIKPRGIHQCPYCGFAPKPQDTGVFENGGRLVGVDREVVKASREEKQRFYQELTGYARMEGYKPGWTYHKYLAKFGEKPPFGWRDLEPRSISDPTRSWIRSQNIRYAKRRAA